MVIEDSHGYSERIPCSKENKLRLMEAMELFKKYHPEARHRHITYNEALGIVVDFYFKA